MTDTEEPCGLYRFWYEETSVQSAREGVIRLQENASKTVSLIGDGWAHGLTNPRGGETWQEIQLLAGLLVVSTYML